PGDQQYENQRGIGEERPQAGELARRIEQRLAGFEPFRRDRARLHELVDRHGAAAGLKTEAGEALEDNGGEEREVADDESEGADIERLLDEALKHIFVGPPGPE